MGKRALVTGFTGQDGSYLAELLLSKGYDVFCMVRRSSVEKYDNVEHIKKQVKLIEGDLLDQSSLQKVVRIAAPDEVYNLAAQSFVPTSFDEPILTGEFTGLGVARVLEAVRIAQNEFGKQIKFYQASSSEMFGKVQATPQNEKTPFYPRSPYGVAKVYGHWITVNYRESYDMFCCSGILFNHESQRRGLQFVTRKITNSLARIKLGLQDQLLLGNLDAQRDWGFAGDYVNAMWLMLQQKEPDDYVIATGESHSVREFVEASAQCLGMDIEWKGKGVDEVGYFNGKPIVRVDEALFRPAEVHTLRGDSTKAREKLGWKPNVSFRELAKMMVENDLASEQQKLKVTAVLNS